MATNEVTANGNFNGIAINGHTNGQDDGSSAASPLPESRSVEYATGQTLLPPLSRRGNGPGLIVILPKEGSFDAPDNVRIENGVPSALTKWAEEGYTVIELQSNAATGKEIGASIGEALRQLSDCTTCQPKNVIGLVCYDAQVWNLISPILKVTSPIMGAVCYAGASSDILDVPVHIPSLLHLSGKAKSKLPRSTALTAYDYPFAKSQHFAVPFTTNFDYAAEAVSHTRNLTFLKKLMNSPIFDLEAIWDEHTYHEFESRSVDHTMATMVQEPYVNHIPTTTGGIGRTSLSSFYANEFIFSNAKDTELELISRTVGIDRVVDEFLFKFTHDTVVNWILPGVPPTGRYLQIPFVAIVCIRGDRLYHEHISWDQGTVLRQLGLLPDFLPFPYLVEGMEGKKMEFRLPVSGVECAEKMKDKTSVVSNEMFEYKIREAE